MDASQGSQKDHIPVSVSGFRTVLVYFLEDLGDFFLEIIRHQDIVLQEELIGLGISYREFPATPVGKIATDSSRGGKVTRHECGIGEQCGRRRVVRYNQTLVAQHIQSSMLISEQPEPCHINHLIHLHLIPLANPL